MLKNLLVSAVKSEMMQMNFVGALSTIITIKINVTEAKKSSGFVSSVPESSFRNFAAY